uniref:BUD13 homolog n=1 Tax=Spongospora subterranea TaxID=70186 RepID=A0A0H5QP01_9EUKA|eukprot:CRZ03322.1 hypothetical protein [Spongospora subterranea]
MTSKAEYLKRYLSSGDGDKGGLNKQGSKKRKVKKGDLKIIEQYDDIEADLNRIRRLKREEELAAAVALKEERETSNRIIAERRMQMRLQDGSGWTQIVGSAKPLLKYGINKREDLMATGIGKHEEALPSIESSPYKGRRVDAPDSSPARRDFRDSSDLSTTRRHRSDSPDLSPDRAAYSRDVPLPRADSPDLSPARRRRADSPDLPPARRSRAVSPILSPARRSRADSPDLSPARKRRVNSLDSAHTKSERPSSPDLSPARRPQSDCSKSTARMQTGSMSITNTSPVQFDHPKTIVRDIHGRVVNVDKAIAEQELLKQEEAAKKEMFWSSGIVQKEEQIARRIAINTESATPFARTVNDVEMNNELKEATRFGDPMFFQMQEKRKKEAQERIDQQSKKLEKQRRKLAKAGVILEDPTVLQEQMVKPRRRPVYVGPAWVNRYGICPGYRWDGVDRTNGWEITRFEIEAKRQATQVTAYHYSVEDM